MPIKGLEAVDPLFIKLNWKAYYKRFCEEHGEPVAYGGRLLFPDGWRYSASDYAGPEYPPPLSHIELHLMKVTYWKTRKRLVDAERKQLSQQLRMLRGWQDNKSVPLQQQTRRWDSERQATIAVAEDIDFESLEGRLKWLTQDVADCDRELNELEEKTNACTK